MGNETILIASAIISCILVYLLINMGKNRNNNSNDDGGGGGGDGLTVVFQLLIIGFISGLFVVMANVAVQDKDNCTWNIANSTTTGSTTIYGYTYECSTNESNNADTLFWIASWVNRLIMMFIVGYLLYVIGKFALLLVKKRTGK